MLTCLRPSKRAANSEDESTLEAIAERLIAQRAVYRKAALDGRRQRKAPANTAKAEATSGPLLAAIHKSSSLELKEKSLDNNQRGVQETQVSVLATNLVQVCPLSLILHSNTNQPLDPIRLRSERLISPCRGFNEGVLSFSCEWRHQKRDNSWQRQCQIDQVSESIR